MKIFLVLLLGLSLVVGVSTNKGSISLFEYEFERAFSAIQAGRFSSLKFITWVLLIISHLAVAILPFLSRQVNRQKGLANLLLWVPLSFLFLFGAYELTATLLLLPFFMVWIMALYVQQRCAKSRE